MLRLTQERERLRLSQAKLARLAEINVSSLSRIENGKEPAYQFRGKRIADALGWNGDPMELFEEVEDDCNTSGAAIHPLPDATRYKKDSKNITVSIDPELKEILLWMNDRLGAIADALEGIVDALNEGDQDGR